MPEQSLVLWQARGTPPRTVELVGVIFGGACLITLAAIALRRLSQSYFIAPVIIFGIVLMLRAIGEVQGRVVLSAEGIEVRRLFTRLHRWETLRTVELDDDGRIEITPNGWARRLPIPAPQGADAFVIITRWRARYAPLNPGSKGESGDEHGDA